MVFQEPNPFPKTIYDNVAWGAKINGFKGDMDILVEQSLRQAARSSDFTAFFNMDDDRAGYLVEYSMTNDLFTRPQNEITEQYITGRFG
jgi:ABC-type phosphate transport system ATPase subunit